MTIKKPTTIAIAGKGGVGKTTIAALLILVLKEKGVVLAIDGDPSSNLNMSLGLPLTQTIGGIREEMAAKVKKGKFDQSVSKPDYIEMKIHEALVESERIDLLAMGRPEGPGCYCAANNFLRSSIERVADNYDFVVIDNEAGMEHISRQTTRDIDILIIISDPSVRSIVTAARVKDLIAEIRTSVTRIYLVINRANSEISPQMQQIINDSKLELISRIPDDPLLFELESRGIPLTELPENSVVKREVNNIANKLGLI